MKVFVGPRSDPGEGDLVAEVARTLAGPQGNVASLRDLGVPTLTRPLTAAELAGLRAGFAGAGPVLGYVCRGTWLGAGTERGSMDAAPRETRRGGKQPSKEALVELPYVVVVTDHANLAWQSPLRGPNDEAVGPRFPSLARVYNPETAASRLQEVEGMIVRRRVVAGVHDDHALLPFEDQMMTQMGFDVASCELVSPVIVAAHMGLQVAAVVVARHAAQLAGSRAREGDDWW